MAEEGAGGGGEAGGAALGGAVLSSASKRLRPVPTAVLGKLLMLTS